MVLFGGNRLTGHTGAVLHVHFSADGKALASGGGVRKVAVAADCNLKNLT